MRPTGLTGADDARRPMAAVQDLGHGRRLAEHVELIDHSARLLVSLLGAGVTPWIRQPSTSSPEMDTAVFGFSTVESSTAMVIVVDEPVVLHVTVSLGEVVVVSLTGPMLNRPGSAATRETPINTQPTRSTIHFLRWKPMWSMSPTLGGSSSMLVRLLTAHERIEVSYPGEELSHAATAQREG